MRLLAVVLVLAAGTAVSAAELPALAGGSWEYHGRVTATACVGSRCATRSQRLDGAFFVTNDGDSGGPPVIPVCPDVSVPDLTGLAAWVPGKRGWFRLRLIDRRTLVEFLRDCTGYASLQLQGLSARVRVQPGGEGFDLREGIRFSVVVQGKFVRAVGAAHLRATRVADGGFAPALRSREGDGRSAPARAIDAIIGDD